MRHVIGFGKFLGSSASVLVALRAIGDKGAPLRVRNLELASYRPQRGRVARTLYTWIHLSDVHFGHHDATHRWDQTLVLSALKKDIREAMDRGAPRAQAVLLTGDVAFSGRREQYDSASDWLLGLALDLGLDESDIFMVPGNHDVDRSVDARSTFPRLLIKELRDSQELTLDSVLEKPEDWKSLTSRMAAFESFAARFPAIQTPSLHFWSHSIPLSTEISIRLVGLNTALLSADDQDRGKLSLGRGFLAQTLADFSDTEIVVVLTHHPLQDGWLNDQNGVEAAFRSKAHIHLSGHIHQTNSETVHFGSGDSLVSISAGALHGDRQPQGVPAGHGYNVASIVEMEDRSLWLRVWPRIWADGCASFRLETGKTPEGCEYAQHEIFFLSK
jgi:predicted MPP superfamily phosphohydrolase